MKNILNRIVEIAENEGITITFLERKIGASKGVLSRAIAKNTDIQSKWIQLIVENYPVYSATWLLTGKGDMLLNESTQQYKNDDVEQLKRLIKAQETVIELQKENAELKAEKEKLTAEILNLKKQSTTPETTSLKREPKFE